MNLSGKTVLLTGASKGLGRALAVQLDAKGCRLLLVARDTVRLQTLQKVLQVPNSQIFPCDLSDGDARGKLIEQIIKNESRNDLLLHCVGVGSHSKLSQLTPEEVRMVLETNTVAPLELTSAFFSLLPKDEPAGIVNIGSVAGELTLPGMSVYNASKAALHAFSRAVSIELVNNDRFCLLVILGALRNTHFGDAINHPANKQPALYRRLDVYPEEAAAQIIEAIERQRSVLVIPAWYRVVFGLNRIFLPLSKWVTQILYRRFR